MNLPPLAIGCDHAGFGYKELTSVRLQDRRLYRTRQRHAFCSIRSTILTSCAPSPRRWSRAPAGRGILICGGANGVAITANKHHHPRRHRLAQRCRRARATTQRREHLVRPPASSRSTKRSGSSAPSATAFEGGRHAQRVGKIPCSTAGAEDVHPVAHRSTKHGTQTLPGRRIHRPALRRQSGRGDAAARGVAGSADAKHRFGEQPERDQLYLVRPERRGVSHPLVHPGGGDQPLRTRDPGLGLVVFNKLGDTSETLVFHSKSGPLRVQRAGDWIALDFPSWRPEPVGSTRRYRGSAGRSEDPRSAPLPRPLAAARRRSGCARLRA